MRNRTRKYRKKQTGGATKKQWINSFKLSLKTDYEKNKELWNFWYGRVNDETSGLEGPSLRRKIISITEQVLDKYNDQDTKILDNLLKHLKEENEPDHDEKVYYHDEIPKWIGNNIDYEEDRKQSAEKKEKKKEKTRQIAEEKEKEREKERNIARDIHKFQESASKKLADAIEEEKQFKKSEAKKQLLLDSLPVFRKALKDREGKDSNEKREIQKRATFVNSIQTTHPKLFRDIITILEEEKKTPQGGIIEIDEIIKIKKKNKRKRKKTPKRRTKRRRKRYGTKKKKRASRCVPRRLNRTRRY